jgi:pyruvate dehydrogenase E1 component beta subunit
MVAQDGFWTLQAPIQRVASIDCHFPFSPALEKLVFPNEEKITEAVYTVLE